MGREPRLWVDRARKGGRQLGTVRQDSKDGGDVFIGLYTRCQPQLYRFLLTLVARPNDAEDLLQRVAQIMWQKFDAQQHADCFYAWACGIARREALKHYRREGVRRRHFSDALVAQLADVQIEQESIFEAQVAALDQCLARLSQVDAELIRARYFTDVSIADLAQEREQSPNALYKSLQRVRHQLFECVTRTLKREAVL